MTSKGDFEKSKKFDDGNERKLQKFNSSFPENTKEGFKTEALPAIWENKEEFNDLMNKSSDDMKKLASIIDSTDNVKTALKEMMWGNCKTCHECLEIEVRSFSFYPKRAPLLD